MAEIRDGFSGMFQVSLLIGLIILTTVNVDKIKNSTCYLLMLNYIVRVYVIQQQMSKMRS